MTQRWKLTIEYDGTDFCGWQKQPNGLSVQSCIEKAISDYTGQSVSVTGAGRTDAGVHAVGMVAHVDIDTTDQKAARDAINFHLRPHPISILSAEPVPEDFHARFQGVHRVYCYKLVTARIPGPALHSRYSWHIKRDLDIAAMNTAAAHLRGTHDFSSFRAADCQAKSAVRTMERLEWIVNDNVLGDGKHLELWAEARSFLHHQIRNITGTLVMVGAGKLKPDDLPGILAAKSRGKAGITAPPNGLHFVRVDYAKEPV